MQRSKMQAVGILSTALRRPETYTGHLREALAAARCAALYPLGLAETALSTGRPAGDAVHDTPVLLVHGYGHNRSGWFLLQHALRRAGFTSIHTMNYVAWGNEGVPQIAERLAARVAAIKALTGAEKVHLVGHSLGGVLIRWYVQELGGDRHVDTAITVASPHEGTVAAMAAPGPCARDLRPGSRVIRRLAAGARPSDVTWVALYSNLDLLVQPAVSGRLRDARLGAENVLVKDHGHLGIMTSPVVVRAIVERLESAEAPMAPVLPIRATRPRPTSRPVDPRSAPPSSPVDPSRASSLAG